MTCPASLAIFSMSNYHGFLHCTYCTLVAMEGERETNFPMEDCAVIQKLGLLIRFFGKQFSVELVIRSKRHVDFTTPS